MEETLRQLGALLLAAIPTVFVLLTVFVSYRFILSKPLERTLQERRDRTEGAMERARADIAAAEARTTEYENALRDARLNVFKAQEARRRAALQSRAAASADARARAEEQVKAAKAAIQQDVAASKAAIQQDSERLAAEVIQAVLKQVGATPAPAGGAR